jgi:hypothetical protein
VSRVAGLPEIIVRSYPLDAHDLINEVCLRMKRNLTPDEWKHYLQGEQYQKTCPNLP